VSSITVQTVRGDGTWYLYVKTLIAMPRPGWIHTYIIMLGISIPLATKTLYLIWDIWAYCGPFMPSSDVFLQCRNFQR